MGFNHLSVPDGHKTNFTAQELTSDICGHSDFLFNSYLLALVMILKGQATVLSPLDKPHALSSTVPLLSFFSCSVAAWGI